MSTAGTPQHQDGPQSNLGFGALLSRLGFTSSFWTFLFAENLYDFGLYIFVLLYNLYLLDLGYREDFLGWVTTAMTTGSILGSLPSAAVVRWLGLKRML